LTDHPEPPTDALNYLGRDEDGEPIWLVPHDYYERVYLVRLLEDGREVVVLPWSGHGAQLSVGRRTGFWDDTWNYERVTTAVSAAKRWDGTGEPTGWHRHPFSGRRRRGGDPDQEYMQP
jgi:hypothetical protein